jgi:hypothetical protein
MIQIGEALLRKLSFPDSLSREETKSENEKIMNLLSLLGFAGCYMIGYGITWLLNWG